MKRFEDKTERGIAAARAVCLTGLALLVALWWREHPDVGVAGRLAALASAALFAALGARFLGVWLRDWTARRETAPTAPIPAPASPATLGKVFCMCLAWIGFTLLLLWVIRLMRGGRGSFGDAMEFWTLLDTQHYLNIARDGYLAEGEPGRVVELVFLPGYPLLVRLFRPLAGSYLAGAMLASALCFAGSGVFLYLLARLDRDHDDARRALKYAMLLPGAVFFAAPMSESLFFLLSISCVYCARRKRWLAACLLGGLAAFTRSLGLTLAAPVCYELIADTLDRRPSGWERAPLRRRIGAFAALLLIPAGFGAYCLVCRAVTGDALAFLTYQREHWGQSLGFFFHTAAYQTENAVRYAREGELEKLIGLWVPNLVCTGGALVILLPAAKRLRPSYTAYFLGYYILAVGTTWLLSGPRYLAALFPIGLALGDLTENRRADDALTVLLTTAYGIYAYALVARWQVW